MTLQLEHPTTFGLLHPDGGMILGRVAADEAEVLTLAVVPAARRRGIGAALLRAAMTRATELGSKVMFLEVAVTNRAARNLYAGHGFAEAGLRHRYYVDGTDALVLRSSLPPMT
jgi:ribosomal-protein-alanine N-acetyltransferase